MKRTGWMLALLMVFHSSAGFGLSAQEAAAVDAMANDTSPWLPPEEKIDAIKSIGPSVIPYIMDLYSEGNDKQKSNLASLLWRLGWPSEDAAMLLLRDIKTPHESLRINVQYALGTLSSNPIVVQSLLDNMRHDENPLLRDKAACALANDQVYLTMRQTYPLLRGLVDGLSDSKAQVRKISIKALKIHTGQTMGFVAHADAQARNEAIYRWQAWLDEYQRAL